MLNDVHTDCIVGTVLYDVLLYISAFIFYLQLFNTLKVGCPLSDKLCDNLSR